MPFTDATLYRVEPALRPRIERVREAIEFLRGPNPRSATAMRDLLIASEFRDYKRELDHYCAPPTPKERDVLRRYNSDLLRGDGLFKRARKLRCVGPQARKRELLLTEARNHYGRIHEMLGELLYQNPLLVYLFDRAWIDDEQSEEPEGMPRRTNAASEHVRYQSLQPATALIAETQRSALKQALAKLEQTGEHIHSNYRYTATSRPSPAAITASGSDVAEFRGVLVQRSGRNG